MFWSPIKSTLSLQRCIWPPYRYSKEHDSITNVLNCLVNLVWMARPTPCLYFSSTLWITLPKENVANPSQPNFTECSYIDIVQSKLFCDYTNLVFRITRLFAVKKCSDVPATYLASFYTYWWSISCYCKPPPVTGCWPDRLLNRLCFGHLFQTFLMWYRRAVHP